MKKPCTICGREVLPAAFRARRAPPCRLGRCMPCCARKCSHAPETYRKKVL